MNGNSITVKSYEDNIQKFIDRTPKDMIGDTKVWIDKVIKAGSKHGKNFEIGSGFGRDADYMRALDFRIICSDVSEGFVKVLKQKGYDAKLFNALEDQFDANYDLIFANAVFEHFTRKELISLMIKIYQSLSPNGLLAFSIRQGQGEIWSNEKLDAPRYFCLWQRGNLKELIEKTGFKITSITQSTGFQGIKRLYIIAHK